MRSIVRHAWFAALIATGGCASGSSILGDSTDGPTTTTTGSGNAGGMGAQGGSGLSGAEGGMGAAAGSGGEAASGADGGQGGDGASGAQGGAGATGGQGGSSDCGNNQVEPPEECDGADLGTEDCGLVGHDDGQLACTSSCTYDTSGCYSCGDGQLDGLEVCDGTNLGGLECTDFGFHGGTLLCAANCLSLNQSACNDCGDGVAQAPEECDGIDYASASCESLGFGPGSLSCATDCTLVTSGCSPNECTDGVDNDGDGFTDALDPGCSGPNGTSELIYADDCHGLGGPIYDVTFADTSLDVFVTGSTVGAPSAFSPADGSDDCSTNPADSGSEVVLFYRNNADRSPVYITLDRPLTNYDSVLYVRQADCQSPQAELCNDDYYDWWYSEYSSELALYLPAGDYYIFVDGYRASAGSFELVIDLPN